MRADSFTSLPTDVSWCSNEGIKLLMLRVVLKKRKLYDKRSSRKTWNQNYTREKERSLSCMPLFLKHCSSSSIVTADSANNIIPLLFSCLAPNSKMQQWRFSRALSVLQVKYWFHRDCSEYRFCNKQIFIRSPVKIVWSCCHRVFLPSRCQFVLLCLLKVAKCFFQSSTYFIFFTHYVSTF